VFRSLRGVCYVLGQIKSAVKNFVEFQRVAIDNEVAESAAEVSDRSAAWIAARLCAERAAALKDQDCLPGRFPGRLGLAGHDSAGIARNCV
jgi:4'-phosphopantetheinyl transferase EntD